MCAATDLTGAADGGSAGSVFRGGSSPAPYTVWPGTFRRWNGERDTFCLPVLSQGLLTSGSMVRFPIHKGYYGKPAHHKGVSTLNGFCFS